MLTFFVVAIALTVSGFAVESSFPLKDLGPTIDEILGSQKPDKTELSYVAARGSALFLSISAYLENNPSGRPGEAETSSKFMQHSHHFAVVAEVLGRLKGKSTESVYEQIQMLMEIYSKEMGVSKQLNNEIMSPPILRDFKDLERIAPLIEGLFKMMENQNSDTAETKPNP